MSCAFKDAFGRPGEGVHSLRFGGLAVVDTLFTVGAAWALGKWWGVPAWKVFVVLVCIGIVMHRMFCVDTALNKRLFGQT